MKLIAHIIVVAGLVASCASAAAVPAEYCSNITPRDSNDPQTNSTNKILNNLSSLFGWQMAGALLHPDLTSAACADISSLGNGKWAAIGLNSKNIQEPLCLWSTDDVDPDSTNIITRIIEYSSEIFLTQILGAFGDEALRYMCEQIDYFPLDHFLLNDTAIIGGVCHSVGDPRPPRAFGPNHPSPDIQDAAEAVKNSATILYAFLSAVGATTDNELDVLCEGASEYTANLNAELMNGTVFEETICSIRDPISVDEAISGVLTWTTRIFITMVENMSNADGWLIRLCDHINTERLDGVHLDGEAVRSTICHDSTANVRL